MISDRQSVRWMFVRQQEKLYDGKEKTAHTHRSTQNKMLKVYCLQ